MSADASPAGWHVVGALDDFFDGHTSAVVAGGVPLALVRVGDEVHALHDRCSHGMARLSDGWVEDGCIECPLHQGRFDLRTGAPLCAPVTVGVATYPVRVVGDLVEVDVSARGPLPTN